MIRYIWSILLFLVVSAYAISNIDGVLLSSDEAFDLLNLEEIDSTTFQNLQDIFREPISVPNNGLNLLKQLFPNSFGDLPSKEDLSKYEPWRLSQIRDFFSDYPRLLSIKDYLDFAVTEKTVKGSAQFSASKPQFRKTIVNRMRFGSSYRDNISITGAVDISTSSILWQSRLLSLRSNRFKTEINIGNFTNSNSFIFGYFPSNYPIYTSNNDVVKGSWIYGKRNSWNGLSLSQSLFNDMIKIELYGHKRLSETVMGGDFIILPNSKLRLSLGGASLSITDSTLLKSMNYLTAGASFSQHKYSTSLSMAYETNSSKLAFSGKLSRRDIGQNWSVEVANISDSAFKRSSIYHKGEYLINRNSRDYNSVSKGGIWYLKARNYNKFCRSLKLSEDITFFSSNSSYLMGYLKVYGDIFAPFSIRGKKYNRSYFYGVSVEPTIDRNSYRLRQTIAFSLINIHNSIMSLSTRYSHINLNDYDRKYINIEILDKIILSKFVEISPLIFYKSREYNSDFSWESGCGFTLNLRDKNIGTGGLSIKLPIIGSGVETVLDNSSRETPFMGVAIYANIVIYI